MSKEKRFELLNMLSFKDKFFDNKNKSNLDSLDVVGILNHYENTLSEFVKRDVEQQNKITDLEAKLAESEKMCQGFIELYEKEKHNNYELFKENKKLNAMIDTLPAHDKELEEIHKQDKISFCIEKLEKVKSFIPKCSGMDMIIMVDDTHSLNDIIDNQIKLLKEGK